MVHQNDSEKWAHTIRSGHASRRDTAGRLSSQSVGIYAIIGLLATILVWPHWLLAAAHYFTEAASPSVNDRRVTPHPANARMPLECFQVAQPVPSLARDGQQPCSLVLMDHVFGWSYGKPFISALLWCFGMRS
jgi:hypothetical protein